MVQAIMPAVMINPYRIEIFISVVLSVDSTNYLAQKGSRTYAFVKLASSLKSRLIVDAGSKNHVPSGTSRSSRSNQPHGGRAILTPPTDPRNAQPTFPILNDF